MRSIWIRGAAAVLMSCALYADTTMEAAAKRLLQGDEKAIPALLQNPEAAVAALTRLRRRGDIPALLERLGADSHRQREAATLALIRCGDVATPAVRKHLEQHRDDPEVAVRCRRILATKPEELDHMAVAVVRFLMQVEGLKPKQILPFAANYRAWLNDYEVPKKFDPQFIRFLQQYAVLPGAAEAVAAKLKDKRHYWLRKVVPIFLERGLHADLKPLIRHPHLRSYLLTALVKQHEQLMTDGKWEAVFDVLVTLPHDRRGLFDYDLYEKNLFPDYFRRHTGRLFEAKHGELHCVALQCYPGNWRQIAHHVQRIFDPANAKLYNDRLSRINIPAKNAGYAIEVILSRPKSYLHSNNVAPLAAKADPFPTQTVLAHVRRQPHASNRFAWAEALLKRHPELRQTVAKNMYQLLHKDVDLRQKSTALRILTTCCQEDIQTGKLDDVWLRSRPQEKYHRSTWMRLAKDCRVTHKLLLTEIIGMEQPKKAKDRVMFGGSLATMLEYVLNSPDPRTRERCINYVLATLQRVNHADYRRVTVLDKIIAARPDSAAFLLKCKLQYFKGEHSSNTVYYVIAGSGGSHGDSFQEINTFIRKHRQVVIKQLKTLQPGKVHTWFPYAATLALDATARGQHGDLLRNVLTAALPELSESPNDLRCAVIAAKALDLAGDAIDRAALQVLRKPPEHYVEEMCWTLDQKNKAILPDLWPLIEKGDKHAVQAAVAVAPDNKDLLATLRRLLLEAKDHKVAMAAATGLGYIEQLPRLSEIPEQRLDWILSTATTQDPTCNSLIYAVERPADAAVLARKLAPLLPQAAEAEEVGYGLDLDDLIWLQPKAQEEVADTLVTMLESKVESHRDFAADNLASCSEAAAAHVDRIHSCLVNERNPELRDDLLWAIANIGRPAQVMEKTVRPWAGKYNGRALFCLARIAADPKDRRTYLKQLIVNAEKDPDTNTVRMVGLVRNQDEIVRPFLIRMLLNGRQTLGPEPKQKWVHRDAAKEAVRRLARKPRHPEIDRAFKEFLQDLIGQHYEIDKYASRALFWSLRTYFKNDLKTLAPQLRKVPFAHRLSRAYWHTKRAIR